MTQQALRRWWAPSLTRRLVLAQMTLTALLWVVALAWLNATIEGEEEQIALGLARRGADAVFSIVQSTRDRPAAMSEALGRLDAYQRAFIGPAEDEPTRTLPKVLVWDGGRSVYRSADAPADAVTTATDTLLPIDVGGRPMRAYERLSADAQTRFVALLPSAAESSGFTFWSRGVLVLPLLISLPLLVLPAWLSARLALSPWRRLSDEITERNAAELSPLRFVARYRELAPLVQAVNGLLDRVRQARQREQSFVADAAHQLRTPLAATQINAEALHKHIHDPAQRQLLDNLMRSSERGSRLVAQLLSLTRAESAAPLEPAWIADVNAFVQQRLADLAPLAAQREVELVFEAGAPMRLQLDPAALSAIIDNLVDNAIKYSPRGKKVCVVLRGHAAEVELEVLDQGPGVAAQWRDRIFDRFFRAPDQQQPGSGLGLAIVKSAVDMHLGTVTVSTGDNGSGLCISVRLPLRR